TRFARGWSSDVCSSDLKFRRIDHHRYASDIRLGGDQVEEVDHRPFRIDQALVHVDIDDLGAVFHLVAGDDERCRIIAGSDQLTEDRKSTRLNSSHVKTS